MASDLFWHVPRWHAGGPLVNLGVSNVGEDIVIELLETETASDNIEPDSYWCERIVGQYMYTMIRDPATGAFLPQMFMHSRVYVAQADAAGVNLRDLRSPDDADTSWLMHKVELFDSLNQTDEELGSWDDFYGSVPQKWSGSISVPGGFDIRVGRKVNEGQSLIWHMQSVTDGTVVPNDAIFLKMWCRVLLRKL